MVLHVIRYLLGSTIALSLFVVPWMYASYREGQTRNYRVVKPGVLHRSGQLTPVGLEQAIRGHHIKSVISLRASREEGQPHPDAEEEKVCLRNGIRFYRLPPEPWHSVDGKVPAQDNVVRFLDIMKNPDNHPVLIHCFAGQHRTGIFCAIYRMEFDGWSQEKAIAEMELCGYDLYDIHADVQTYLTSYQTTSSCCAPDDSVPHEHE